MTYEDIKKSADTFRPAFWLDDFLDRGMRSAARRILYVAVVAAFILASEAVTSGTAWVLSLAYLSLCLLSFLIAFELYYNSFRYGRREDGMTIELAALIRATDPHDLTGGFMRSAFGENVLVRLGIDSEAAAKFLSERKAPVTASAFSLTEPVVSLAAYASAIFEHDKDFKDFLFKEGILESDLDGTISWLAREINRVRERNQWWTKRSLSKIQGLGKAWSYGQSWLLEKYGHEAYAVYDYSTIDVNASYHNAEVEELEVILSRSSEANALLVGEEGSGASDVLARLAKRLSLGMVFPSIEGKRMFVLDTNLLVAATGEKNAFEAELMKLMEHSIKAGNIVLVIPDLSAFMASAHALGSDVASILDPYLRSSRIQMIAVADSMSFHQTIETNPLLAERFERVLVKGGSEEQTLRLLEDKVAQFEKGSGLFFTYPGLQAVAQAADRYITTGVMPDKALDLLVELVPAMKAAGKRVIGKTEVMDHVEAKTGIPVAGIKAGERDRLTRLEEILHARIVGQEAAVEAISTAMRRARSGISNPDRPMGSFLFLGPTGVGKTETTKALAEVFFGSEDKILRFDMSEYSSDDALSRLIGSFESGKPGTLTSLLRENPYGVLLLDEFEKASKEVHNLFLQVIDEGVFSDMVGKKVNARNLIIIVTSNAGAQTLWDITESGGSLADAKDRIIDEIVKSGIYKPELINRFDGVILFHPLADEHLRRVAALMLERLKSRLESQRINLKITDTLVNFLVTQGSDPKFGARPLNRAIQEKVEGVIAQKIIRGEVAPGAEIELSQADLEAGDAVKPSPAASG